jgi:hypothetical protein
LTLHQKGDDCWCNPTNIPVKCEDGSIGWVTAHHEKDQTPEQEADRAIRILEAIEIVRSHGSNQPDTA